MLSSVQNNQRRISAVIVKFTLCPCVVALLSAFMFAGIAAAENPDSPTAPLSRSKTPDATEHQQKSSFSLPGTNLFSSLRFWEKNNKPQQKLSSSPENGIPIGKAFAKPKKQELPAATYSVPVEQPVAPATYARSPSEIVSEPSANVRVGSAGIGFGDAPLPMRQTPNFDYDTGSDAPIPQEAKSNPASYSSYSFSFDTRDWIESFPLLHDPPEIGTTVPQKTALRPPVNNPPREPIAANKDDYWNGQATTLTTSISGNPTSGNPSIRDTAMNPVSMTVVPSEKPLIGLSPANQGRLPYTTTCGMVVVQANFPLTEIVAILEEINMLQHDLKCYIGIPAPKEKIDLCLFKDEASYLEFLKESFPKAPRDRRALYIKLDNKPGTLLVQKSKNFEIDLRHEMTHAIIHASIATVPIWLDEGLAKYFELPPHERAAGGQYMTQIRWNVRLGNVPALVRLTKLETIDDMGAKEYRDSWAWTHFLIHRSPETHQLLASYLQLLADLQDSKGSPTQIPSLKLYLDDIMPNQREAFKEHFSNTEK